MSTYDWVYAQQPVLAYFGDPMCSWCYGIAPELNALVDAMPDYTFQVVLGGLRPGGTETMAELGDFLDHHWKEVHARSGQPFNHDILKNTAFVLDTEPGCRAVVAARMMQPGIELAFFQAVQHAFFVDNKSMTDPETFVAIASQFGLDADRYREVFLSEDCRYQCQADFQLSAAMGVRGFPSVAIQHDGQWYMVANGYSSVEEMLDIVARITGKDPR